MNAQEKHHEQRQRSAILGLLGDNGFHTGEAMSRVLGVTRAAVWKHIQGLRREGYAILAQGRKGYRLKPPFDSLMPPFLQVPGCEVFYEATLPSTNRRAAELARKGAAHGCLIVADQQSEGRGRRGRDWFSPPGSGAWFSLLLRPCLSPGQTQSLTLLAALCAAEAIDAFCPGQALIKWPNDLVMGGRKIGGILLEMSVEGEQTAWVVLGMGLNLKQGPEDFPPELREKAGSLAMFCQEPLSRSALIAGVVAALWKRWPAFLDRGLASFEADYARRSATLGRRVRVEGHDQVWEGVAQGLGPQGELLILDDTGTDRVVWAGDVSVRGLLGYV